MHIYIYIHIHTNAGQQHQEVPCQPLNSAAQPKVSETLNLSLRIGNLWATKGASFGLLFKRAPPKKKTDAASTHHHREPYEALQVPSIPKRGYEASSNHCGGGSDKLGALTDPSAAPGMPHIIRLRATLESRNSSPLSKHITALSLYHEGLREVTTCNRNCHNSDNDDGNNKKKPTNKGDKALHANYMVAMLMGLTVITVDADTHDADYHTVSKGEQSQQWNPIL